MPPKSQEILTLIIVTTIVLIILAGIIISFLFLYQGKKIRHNKEMTSLKDGFEKELLNTKVEIQEQTLLHISSELHDNYTQVLSFVNLSLARLPFHQPDKLKEQVIEVKQAVKQLLIEVKNLSLSLRSDTISKNGFLKSFKHELYRLEKVGAFSVVIEEKGDYLRIDPEKEVILFRICQEALNNIIKHSYADKIRVQIYYDPTYLSLLIEDNGKGFDILKVENTEGNGLKNIRNRALLINSEILIRSEPGRTCLSLSVGLNQS